MAICAFFGHRSYDYEPYENDIKDAIVDLIENHGVTAFYSGGRGHFDGTCARIVHELKEKYPNIKNIQVLSYRPTKNFEIGINYDETVYLLEKNVPWQCAILRTNRELVKIADYIISGVCKPFGGAKKACDYAEHLQKEIYYVVLEHYAYELDLLVEGMSDMGKDNIQIQKIKEEKKRLWEKLEPKLKRIEENSSKENQQEIPNGADSTKK